MADPKQVAALAKKKSHERTDADWEAIYDAKTLVNAEVVKSDPTREQLARLWAAVLLMEDKTENKALEQIANG